MMKLLYVPTGNVFTLPDEEVMNIKKNDRANNYKILDGGFIEEQPEEHLSEEEVQEILEGPSLDEPEDKEEKEEAPKPSKPIEEMQYQELRALGMRLGLKGNLNKEEFVVKIKEILGE